MHIQIHAPNKNVYVYIDIYIYIYIYTYTYIHTYLPACLPACLHACMRACIHTYIFFSAKSERSEPFRSLNRTFFILAHRHSAQWLAFTPSFGKLGKIAWAWYTHYLNP